MPTYKEFNHELETRFIDPNLNQLEYQSITKMIWEPSKETMSEFFTWFEIQTGYLRIDKELIHFLKQKIPQYYRKQLYFGGAAIPTTYDAYKSHLLTIYIHQQWAFQSSEANHLFRFAFDFAICWILKEIIDNFVINKELFLVHRLQKETLFQQTTFWQGRCAAAGTRNTTRTKKETHRQLLLLQKARTLDTRLSTTQRKNPADTFFTPTYWQRRIRYDRTGFSGRSVDNAALLQILPPIVTPSSCNVPSPMDQNCTYIASNITTYSSEDPTSKSATEESDFVKKRRPVGDPTLNKLVRTTHPLHGSNQCWIDYDTRLPYHEIQDRYPPPENYLITVGDAQQNQTIDESTRKFDIANKTHMELDHSAYGLSKSNGSIKTWVPDRTCDAETKKTHFVQHDKKAVTNWWLGSWDINYEKTDCSIAASENTNLIDLDDLTVNRPLVSNIQIDVHGLTSSDSPTRKQDLSDYWVPDSRNRTPPFQIASTSTLDLGDTVMEDLPSRVASGRSTCHKKPLMCSPAVKPGRETSPNLETRHHLQQQFHGNKCTPHTARWVA